MKKIICIILIMFLGSFLFSELINFSEAKSIESSEIKQSNNGGNILVTDFGNIEVFAEENYDGKKSILKLQGYKKLFNPGNPILSQKNLQYKIDGNYEITNVLIKSGNFKSGYTKGIVQNAKDRLIWKESKSKSNKTKVASNNNDFFPGRWNSYNYGFDGKNTIINVQLFPLQWNPASKELYQLTDYEIVIYGYHRGIMNLGSRHRFRTDAEHIIITPDNWLNIADSLAQFNTSQGIESEAFTLSEISSNYEAAELPHHVGYANQINNSIQQYDYELARKITSFLRDDFSHQNLEYVTLIGDGINLPPSYYFYSEEFEYEMDAYNAWIPSDFFYASPDYDWVANFGVGRLSFNNSNQFSNYIHKLENWYNSWNNSWIYKASVGGGVAFESPFFTGELISNHAITENIFDGYEIEKYFATLGNFSSSNLSNHMINDSHLLHLQICHGSGNSVWFDDETSISSYNMLNFPEKFEVPIYLSVACVNGAYDTNLYQEGWSGASFAEGLIRSPGAGIAYIGGSRSNGGEAIYDINDGNLEYYGQNDTYALLYFFLKAYREIDNPTFGDLVKRAQSSFLFENDMENEFNKLAYVRFIAHANSGMILPPAPQQTSGSAVPAITLNNHDGFEDFYQFITLNSETNALYNIDLDEDFDHQAYELSVYSSYDEFIMEDYTRLTYGETINSSFEIDCQNTEQIVLNKLICSDEKEAWHWSKININQTETNENTVNKFDKLKTCYPNPFYSNKNKRDIGTTISFDIEKDNTSASIIIYNIKGQKVKSLLDEKLKKGSHKINWKGKDEANKNVSSGIYFVNLKTDKINHTRKIVMLE